MKINAHTKISHILKASPDALETIIKLSPKFVKLRNPLLRKIMAPRVNIEEAAKMGGCKAADFYAALQPFGFILENENTTPENTKTKFLVAKPDWLKYSPDEEIKYLDVRPVISSGKDPLEMIMKSIKENGQERIICIINSFEPIPLITLLKQKGFTSYVEYISPEEIHTFFRKADEKKDEVKPQKQTDTDSFMVNQRQFNALAQGYEDRLYNVDVRLLDMPLPMLTILENLEQLPEQHALYVHHKKVPLYLLPELDERGFEYHICEVEENNVKLLIHHKK